jgi:hypothetical protein
MKYRKKPVVIDAIQWDGTTDCWFALREFAKIRLPLVRRSDMVRSSRSPPLRA